MIFEIMMLPLKSKFFVWFFAKNLRMWNNFCTFASQNAKGTKIMTAIKYNSAEEKRAARQRMLDMKAAIEMQMKIKLASMSL